MQGAKAVWLGWFVFFQMVGWVPLIGHEINLMCYDQHLNNNNRIEMSECTSHSVGVFFLKPLFPNCIFVCICVRERGWGRLYLLLQCKMSLVLLVEINSFLKTTGLES